MTKRVTSGTLVMTVLLAACGGSASDGDPTAATVTAEVAPPATAPAAASTAPAAEAPIAEPAAPAPESPAVAALSSGRGDDGSLEVGIWFTTDPFVAGDARVLVGADSDGSFPGSGDPVPHLDGWVEITSDGVALFDNGVIVADDTQGDLGEWLAWTGPSAAGFVYFFGNVPTRAGTIWIVIEIDGKIAPGGVAGAPFGTACSYRSAGVEIGPVASDVPDPGVPCRYPLG